MEIILRPEEIPPDLIEFFEPIDFGKRSSVLTVNTKGFSGAHFAVFPPALVKPMIKAGSSERGCCPECGAGWRRVIEKSRTFESGSGKSGNMPSGKHGLNMQGGGDTLDVRRGPVVRITTVGWLPACTCINAGDPIPAMILDPFVGAGTTLLVAEKLGRDSIGIELSPEYAAMSVQRIHRECGTMFTDIRVDNCIIPLEQAVDEYLDRLASGTFYADGER